MPALIINKASLNEVLQGRNGPVVQDLVKRTLRVQSAAKRLCPVDHGRLRASIRQDLRRDGRGYFGRVGTDVSYALAVHNGTRAHQIGSKRGPNTAIKFTAGGTDIFVSFPNTVTIPARAGKPFLTAGLAIGAR